MSKSCAHDVEAMRRRRDRALRVLLEEPVVWDTLLPDAIHRTHDDNDGDRSQALMIARSPDGDMWVSIPCPPLGGSLRFREPVCGGGHSPRVHAALRVLMVAMQRDAVERPTPP